MNSISNTRRTISLFIIIALSLLFNVNTTHAESAEEESIRSALVSLGVETISQEVVSTLAGIWPDRERIQNFTSDKVDNQLELSIRTWQIVAPEWREVPASFMIQVRKCRDSSQGIKQSSTTTSSTIVGQCDERLLLQLRFQHAERLTNRFTERNAEAGTLPEPSRTFALQTLATLRERVQTRLQEMLKLSQDSIDDALQPLGEDQESVNQVRTRLEQQIQQTSAATSAPQTNNTTNNQQGSKP